VLLVIVGCTRNDVQSARAVENANRLLKDGKYDEATQMYQRAVELNPRNGEAYYRLALMEWDLGRGKSLERNLVRAVDLQPSNMEALEKLSELYLMSYRRHDDVRWRQRYMTEMEQRAAQMLQIDPRSPQGQRIKGYLAFFKGDYATASRLFGAALQAAPNSPYADDVAASRVSAMLKQGLLQDAQSAANEYLAAHPGANEVYDALVNYYKENNQSDLAIEMLRRKVGANQQNTSAIFELATAYRAAGRERDMERTLDEIRSAPERFPNGYDMLADFYARASDYSHAMEALRAGQAQQPKRALDYSIKECELLVRQRRSTEAYHLVRSLAPSSLSTEQRIARQALLAELGFPDGTETAIPELKALASSAPRDHRVLVALARAFQKQGKQNEASSLLDRAEFLAPNAADVHIARAQFFRSQRDFARMRDAAERALTLEPDLPEALLARGIAMTMLGEVPAALRDLRAVQKQWPDDPDVIHHIALLDMRQGRDGEAEAGLKRAASTGYLPSILTLSDMYTRQGRPEMALQMLRPVMSADKVDPEIGMAHARAAIASGDHASAIAELRQLVAKTPGNASVSLQLISALQRSGDNAGALAAARTASQSYGRNPEVLARFADLILATGGSKAEAKSLFEAALREQPDHPAGAKLACLILETGGDRTEALSLAQRLSRLNSDDPDVVSCITRAFTANGLNEQALRMLEALVQKQPASAGLRLELAQAYLNAGNKLKGRNELEAAKRLNPTPQQSGQVRAALEKLGPAPISAVDH
jgi:cellulose synthase operon protein C